MKRTGLLKKINNEKGVAAVLVLAVILVLTALGTIALIASAANVSMGSKARLWSQEYYALDSQAEDVVRKIDEELQAAEEDARTYVQNRYDTLPSTSSAFTALQFSEYDMAFPNKPQDFFEKHYKDTWTTTGGIVITVQDYIDKPEYLNNPDAARKDYSDTLDIYLSEVYDRIYYYLASKRLHTLAFNYRLNAPKAEIVLKGGLGKPGDPDSEDQWCTNRFINVTNLTDWLLIGPQDGDVGLYIYASNDSAEDPKRVEAAMDIKVPRYETVIQTINTPYKGNPLLENALSVRGKISIAPYKHINVEGDVYASGTGIEATTGSSISIKGNVYSAGDVAAAGDGADIHVYSSNTATTSPDFSYTNKAKTYDNDLGFDKSIVGYMGEASSSIDNYTEDGAIAVGSIPFVYRDLINWGNVYCSSLTVNEGVKNARLTVDGNLWTKDDVQLDGTRSFINIGSTAGGRTTNYIGLDSESTENDPNASSSIINNQPFEADGTTTSSFITINSNIVVPGVAFYEYAGGPEASRLIVDGTSRYYYKSVESVSARTTSPASILEAYFYDPSAGGSYDVYNTMDGGEYRLIAPQATKLDTFINYMNTSGSEIKTNIVNNLPAPAGYVAGAALMQPERTVPAALYANSAGAAVLGGNDRFSAIHASYNALNTAGRDPTSASPLKKGALMDIFTSKTSWLGTAKQSSDFSDYAASSYSGTDPGMIYIHADPAGSSYEIIGNIYAIIYCEGDLTVTGTGTLNGAVICNGDLTVADDVTINYSESIISNRLKNSTSVRNFFAKGMMGSDIGFIPEYASTSGTRTILKRYKVISWKEMQG